MTVRTALCAGLAGVVLVGCGAPDPAAEKPVPAGSTAPAATSSAALLPGARALAALQSSVADLGAVEVSGGAPDGIAGGTIRAASDLRTGEFRATVDLGGGKGVLRMLRQNDLTWTTAPPSFWTGLGYTPDSARRARGKWVVARVEAIKALVESLDPGVAVRALLELEPEDVLGVATVAEGELRGRRVLRFRQGGREQAVYVTTGARPRLLRITASTGSGTTSLDFLAFPTHVRVSLPKPADVLPSS